MSPLPRTVVQALELPPFDPLNRRAAELTAAGHHVISLGQAVPYFGPPPAAVAAARAALDTSAVHRYVTDPGLPSLRRALAERLATPRRAVAPEEVIVTAGANHAFALAHATLVNPGDEVILPSPYFTNHQMMAVTLGATAIEAPVADRTSFNVTWRDLEPHVTARTRAIVLCNPSNPAGSPIAASDGEHIAGEAARRGIWVISDETYLPFVYEGERWSAWHAGSGGSVARAATAAAPAAQANVIVVGTFSKAFGMMGWRVGFMLADAAICEDAIKVQDSMIICAPVMSQIMAEAAVRECWDYTESFHGELWNRRQILADGLAAIPQVSWTPTRGGMFAFARVEGCANSMQLALDLLEHAQVVTMPGSIFGSSGEGHLRLSYGFATPDELREACRRIKDFLGR